MRPSTGVLKDSQARILTGMLGRQFNQTSASPDELQFFFCFIKYILPDGEYIWGLLSSTQANSECIYTITQA